MLNKEKLDSLTSLRFFAAAMIIIGHAHHLFGSAGIATNFSLTQGVSFFFVLSGFILAYNYPVLTDKSKILLFYKTRFARIWPAHIAAILFFILIYGSTNTSNLSPDQTLIAAVANITITQAWIPYRDYYLSFNAVAWSISTEFFFYIWFPLLVYKIKKHWACTLIALLSIIIFFILMGSVKGITANESETSLSLMGLLYVNPLVRIFEFFIGMLAYLIFAKVADKKFNHSYIKFTLIEILCIAATVFSLWFSPRLIQFTHWNTPIANVVRYYLTKSGSTLFFFLLVLIFALQKGAISNFLKRKLFIFLGEISFALYPNVASLQALQLEEQNSYLLVNMLWKAIRITKNTKISLHILDKENNIVWQKDVFISNPDKLKQEEYWLEKIKIPKELVKDNWDKLGIAMYVDPKYLFSVTAPQSDWNGLRATLSVKDFHQLLAENKVI